MEIEVLTEDYGQGDETIILPVVKNRHREKWDNRNPYTVKDVLTEFYGEDFEKIITSYIRRAENEIRKNSVLVTAANLHLVSCTYKKCISRVNQVLEKTIVDIIVEGRIAGEKRSRIVQVQMDFRLRYILDMRPCRKRCIGPLVLLYDGEERIDHQAYMYPADEYLLPIINKKDYDKIADDMRKLFYPQACSDNYVTDGESLAAQMGLKVIEVRFADTDLWGQVYLWRKEEQLLDDSGKEYTMTVEPMTILISKDRCRSAANRNVTIVHECFHVFLHRSFFLLQMMAGSSSFVHANRKGTEKPIVRTAIDWMELQCEKMPAYLLMEKKSVTAYAENYIMLRGGRRSVTVMNNLLQKVAKHYNVSVAMAKYRLVELGFTELLGISCYLDGRYIADHSCSGMWPEGISFSVDSKEAAALLKMDADFSDLVRSGKYLYVDGHFCLNAKRYLEKDWRGCIRLTSYAKSHIDECCIGFHILPSDCRHEYRSGSAAKQKTKPVNDKYRSKYLFACEPDTKGYDAENNIFAEDSWLWGDFLYEMSDDYSAAIKDIMKRKGITQEQLALDLEVDRKVIYNCLNARNPSKPHLVAICVALHLPYDVSEKILKNAGISLRRTEMDHLFRRFLLYADGLSVPRCEDILKSRKMPTLFAREDFSEKTGA